MVWGSLEEERATGDEEEEEERVGEEEVGVLEDALDKESRGEVPKGLGEVEEVSLFGRFQAEVGEEDEVWRLSLFGLGWKTKLSSEEAPLGRGGGRGASRTSAPLPIESCSCKTLFSPTLVDARCSPIHPPFPASALPLSIAPKPKRQNEAN